MANKLAWRTFDGNSWSDETVVADVEQVANLAMVADQGNLALLFSANTEQKVVVFDEHGNPALPAKNDQSDDARFAVLEQQTAAYAALTSSPPSLRSFVVASAYYRGAVRYVHSGVDPTGPLLWQTYRPATNKWSTSEYTFPNTACGPGPAVCVFAGVLHCFHQGVDSENGDGNTNVYWCVSDGLDWSADRATPFTSPSALAIAAHAGMLFCAYLRD
ncbi:hypothetical protein JOF56_009274 [Kibdelosporangium banguiense]|uniref:Uncharacterized protein n=1 Tax=Kibdelosporangium banguiense TaxID=1365924 RepID=A0ABS4TWW1_9PSEU|nr:hypothetical protein [Kibdelosporangium banguiense]MBP2328889.1 hypothetical protein [Kibdelosporangium banguiense]